MKKKSLSILIAVAMTATTILPAASVFAATTPVTVAPVSSYGVTYDAHVQSIGWQASVKDGADAGTIGLAKRLEALKISLNGTLPAGAHIEYSAHVQSIGWQSQVEDGAEAGTDGQAKRVEAVKINLAGLPGYSVEYRVQGQTYGWQGWVADGAIAGTTGQAKRLETIEIKIVKTATENAAEVAAINDVATAQATPTAANVAIATSAIALVQDKTENASLTTLVQAINVPLAVSSVSAINADQLKVVFTAPVDSAASILNTNYLVNNVSVFGTPVLQSDNKTVIITLTTPLVNASTNVYEVKPILSADGATSSTVYTNSQVVSDTTAPTVTSATASTNGATATSVTVNYSEPVASGVIKIDGVGHSVTPGNTSDTFTGLSLDATKAHSIEYINLTDEASTPNVTVDGTLAFNVTTDATAPVISSLSQLSDKQVLVTFNKAIKASTITTVGAVTASTINGAAVTAYTVSSVVANPKDTTGTQYIVTISTTPIYSSTVTSHNVLLGFTAGITDTVGAGNALTATSKNITLTKDTTAPTVTGIVTKKNSAGIVTDILVNYSKPLAAKAAIASSALTITDSNGVLITPATLLNASNVVNANDTQVDFPLAAAASTFNAKYTISVPASLVKDESETANQSTGLSGLIDLTQTASATPFKLALLSATNTAADVITVNYGAAVKGGAITGSATDPSNYSINGNVLPAGTSITLNAAGVPTVGTAAQTIATITLPKGFIPTTDGNAVFRIANVQRVSDSTTITPYVDTFNVEDNTAPVLQAANVTANNTIILTYSEAVDATGDGTSFSILNNGVAVDGLVGDVTVATVPGYTNKLQLTLKTTNLDLTKSITIGAINSGVTDIAVPANAQAATSQITATQN
jgi:uncharacterized protein YjdB